MTTFGTWMTPLTIVLIVGIGLVKGVKVFEVFLEGAKEGLEAGVRILPALVALITAVGMFKASGGLDLISFALKPVGELLGLPQAVLPLALMRPISGSGSLVIFSDLLQSYGADSLIGRIASVMQGSTETTFYVIAVYYGAAGIRETRQTAPAALLSDVAGFFIAALGVKLFFYT